MDANAPCSHEGRTVASTLEADCTRSGGRAGYRCYRSRRVDGSTLMRPLEATPFQAVDRALLSGSEPLRTRLRIAMDNTRLPDDIRALNAKLKANPVLTENMGPVHVLTVQGRSSGRPQATPVSPVTCGGHRLAATLTVAWRSRSLLDGSGWGRLAHLCSATMKTTGACQSDLPPEARG